MVMAPKTTLTLDFRGEVILWNECALLFTVASGLLLAAIWMQGQPF